MSCRGGGEGQGRRRAEGGGSRHGRQRLSSAIGRYQPPRKPQVVMDVVVVVVLWSIRRLWLGYDVHVLMVVVVVLVLLLVLLLLVVVLLLLVAVVVVLLPTACGT